MNIVGKVISVLDARSGVSQRTGNEWYSREFVIETEEQYPTKLCIRVSGKEKWEQWNVQLGNKYDVSFNVSSREWQGKWYTGVDAWKITLVSESTTKNNDKQNAEKEQIKKTANNAESEQKQTYSTEQTNSSEDLPF